MPRTVHILLVDDNPADADLMQETLQGGRLEVSIKVACGGSEALASLRRCALDCTALPDLMLLDLNMPGVSGQDVLLEMRSDPRLRRLPVVILSSSDAERDVSRCYEAGANCFITKPCGLVEFQRVVQSVEDFWFSVAKLPAAHLSNSRE